MIESFGDSATESIYRGLRVRGLSGDIQKRARRELRMINQARIVEDLLVPPGNRLEQLKEKLSGFWSIRHSHRGTMRTVVFLAALSLLQSACTAPPPVNGTFLTKAGQIRVHPDGRFV